MLQRVSPAAWEDDDAGVDGGGFAAGMTVEDGAQRDADIDIGDADEHADTAIGQLLGHSIWSRSFEVSLSMEDQRRLRWSCAPGASGVRDGPGWRRAVRRHRRELGLKSVLEHGRVCGRGEVKGAEWLDCMRAGNSLHGQQGYHGGQKPWRPASFALVERGGLLKPPANILKQIYCDEVEDNVHAEEDAVADDGVIDVGGGCDFDGGDAEGRASCH